MPRRTAKDPRHEQRPLQSAVTGSSDRRRPIRPQPTIRTLVLLASIGLGGCGSSSTATRQAQLAQREHAQLLELVSCARRHGIPLPPPVGNTESTRGVNLKGHRRKAVINACYQKAIYGTGPRRLGEEPGK